MMHLPILRDELTVAIVDLEVVTENQVTVWLCAERNEMKYGI